MGSSRRRNINLKVLNQNIPNIKFTLVFLHTNIQRKKLKVKICGNFINYQKKNILFFCFWFYFPAQKNKLRAKKIVLCVFDIFCKILGVVFLTFYSFKPKFMFLNFPILWIKLKKCEPLMLKFYSPNLLCFIGY